MLQSEVNRKNIQRIIRFFTRVGENGYIFAYAEQSSLIKEVNQALMEQLEANRQSVGLIFLKEEDSVIQRIREAAEQGSKAIIIGNLYSLMSQEKTGLKQLTELNFSRESLYNFNVPILFWITEDTFSILANKAADLYSQRRFSTIIFEKEELETSAELPGFEDETQAPQESTKLQLLKEQFEEALQQKISDTQLSSEYLLPYLKELALNYHYDKVKTLFEQYESQIDLDNIENLRTLGDIFSEIHDYERALDAYSQYLDTNEKDASLGYVLLKRGDLYINTGNLSEARKDFEAAEKYYIKSYKASPDTPFYKEQLAVAYSKLGETHSALGNLDQALRFFEQRSELGKQLFKDYPTHVSFKSGLAIAYEKLGETHSALGNLEQALRFFDNETELFEQLFKDYPTNVALKSGLAISYAKLGETHAALGNLDQALRFFENFSSLMVELFQDYPKNASFKNGLAVAYFKLGEIHKDKSNTKGKTLSYFKKCQSLLQELVEQAKGHREYEQNLQEVTEAIQELEN
ncbi:MAG: hypothetical protein Roseis3KO_17240 [Roseivirga sp.]